MVHDPVAFARWHLGEIEWRDALGSAIEVRGSRTLARALPTWNRRGGRVEEEPAPIPTADSAYRATGVTELAASRH